MNHPTVCPTCNRVNGCLVHCNECPWDTFSHCTKRNNGRMRFERKECALCQKDALSKKEASFHLATLSGESQ